ncbi:MAG TPA: polymer-forming cytoskeletal protein [Candidatus Angelobacter sp.]|nr:polymer-forming cytoskeletal protein [Candidatus Angelobacter sp.]
MWKARPEDNRLPLNNPQPASATASAAPTAAPAVKETPKFAPEPLRGDVGHIGKSVVIRGELTGSEDLYLDGEVEGTINLRDHKLVIGPNGKIKAAITARDIVVHGKVEGNIGGSERVELKRSSSLSGDITTHRIVIEDGALFKGAVDIKEHAQEHKTETRKSSNSGSHLNSGSTLGAPVPVGAGAGQGSFLESK